MSPATLDELIDVLAAACPVYVAARRLSTTLVSEALAAGLASEWDDSPVGPAVLLSSLACEQRGLILSDDDVKKARWIPATSDRVVPSRAPSEEVVPDRITPGPGPLESLIAHEEQVLAWNPASPAPRRIIWDGRRSASVQEKCIAPRPVVILVGTGRIDWSPAIERPGAKPCPVCRNRELSPIETCLGCLRSGIDDRLPAVPDHEKPKANSTPRGSRCPELSS